MKQYVKPIIENVKFKIEERLASGCTGCCTPAQAAASDGGMVAFTYS